MIKYQKIYKYIKQNKMFIRLKKTKKYFKKSCPLKYNKIFEDKYFKK